MVKLSTFKGKKVLITGGSSGIGLATAKALSDEGAEIIITARSKEKLKKTAEIIKGNVSTYTTDVSDLKQVLSLAENVRSDHGNIDVLINSAGIVHPGTLKDLSMEQIDSTLDIDLKGTIHVTKAILPLIRSPGYIVNISSVAGFIGIYGYTAYSAAKFGIWGFSQSLRMELEPEDIGVAVVFPPDTNTPQLEFENRTKPEELKEIAGAITPISPDKVAASIIKGMKQGEHMIFPDSGSRSTYHASRLAGPLIRGWMDRKVDRTRKKE